MSERKEKERRSSTPYKSKIYFDSKNNTNVVKVLPGEYKTTAEPSETLVTTLGSCVSACIRDPHTGFGGMNHFMLPANRGGKAWRGATDALRYGNHAMEILINEIIRSGCPREELEIKVFGGGNVIKGPTSIGSDNAKFVLEYLKNEGLKAVAQDLGGQHPRRIHYSPTTGKVNRLVMRRSSDDRDINKEEVQYQRDMQKTSRDTDDDVELFDD